MAAWSHEACITLQSNAIVGVRRIVAVTAEASHESVTRANDLLSELRLVANGEQATIGEQVTRLRTKFEDMSSSLPAIAKYEIEQLINNTLKSYMQFKKEQIKEREAGAITALEEATERSSPFIVHRVDLDAKSLKVITRNCTVAFAKHVSGIEHPREGEDRRDTDVARIG